jgi:phosphopantothenoylcysteine synthetase/decarboxylase
VEWNCNVSLRRHLPEGNVQIIQFANTSDRDRIESILRRARRAILNPNIDVEVFRTETANTGPPDDEQMFSEDTVIAEIVGMDMDITFIDLPGLISSVSTCEKQLML